MMECNVVMSGGSNLSSSSSSIHLSNDSNTSSMDYPPMFPDYSYNASDDMYSMPEMSNEQIFYRNVEHFLYSKLILIICIFGMVGNLLNLLVLSRKSVSTRMERMEKSAHLGLIALACSDLAFCISAFPHSLQDRERFDYDHVGFWLLYKIYGNAVINVFIMSSTWLTVAMALSRYIAVCYPMKGREILGVTFSRCAIALVFGFCIIFNLPRFWMSKVDFVNCEGGWKSYYAAEGPMQQSKVAETIYHWFYLIFCILLPLLILTYCNMYLLRALRMSANMRREHTRGKDTAADSKNIVTLTLTIIVILYILLVTPAEVLVFAREHVTSSLSWLASDRYNMAVAIGNTLQALNFAANFVLYCVINVHFRRALARLFRCRNDVVRGSQHKLKRNKLQRSMMTSSSSRWSLRWSVRYESVTRTTFSTTCEKSKAFPATCSRL